MIICWANLLTIIYIAKLFLNFVAFYFQFLWYFIFNYCDKTLLLLYQLQEVDTKIFINEKSPTYTSDFNFIHKYLNNIKYMRRYSRYVDIIIQLLLPMVMALYMFLLLILCQTYKQRKDYP